MQGNSKTAPQPVGVIWTMDAMQDGYALQGFKNEIAVFSPMHLRC
jgi:hypothetical protein